MSIYKKSILACALLPVAGVGHCGTGDKSWLFMPMEQATYDTTSNPSNTGMELGCNSFTPDNFLFVITYSGPPELEKRVYVETDNKNNVTHNRFIRTFYVQNPKRMVMGLPHGGIYTITNSSSSIVKGSECDSGLYD